MNLRNVESYDIGLDIGTASVGWSVVDEDGQLCHFKGKPTWGSRVFPGADTAADTRIRRGQRRRYDRRRQRLNLLQGLFAVEMEKIDEEFFLRLNQARLHTEDRQEGCKDYAWPLFNDEQMNEIDYYRRFPTIYHLREWLMNTDEQADIRLIYLALHNIVKHRGNFLHQDNPKLSAKNANMKNSLTRLCHALEDWCDYQEIPRNPKLGNLEAVFSDTTLGARAKQEALVPCFGLEKDYKQFATALSRAVVGYKVEFAQIFFTEPNESNFALLNDEKVDEFSTACPDEGLELFESLQAVYSSFVLMGILSGADGGTISTCKVREYGRYSDDLARLKSLVRRFAPDAYEEFFRGSFYEGTQEYDVAQAKGYTRYNLGTSKLSYEDFIKEIRKLFAGTQAEHSDSFAEIQSAMDEGVFLRRQKTSDNGSIPYQLHLEEMHAIIHNQSKYYPFLRDDEDKLESLVTFRIPYYVGPLTQVNAALSPDGKPRFAWSERKPGKEKEKIYPWNWEDIIDKDASAEAFVRRMTGTCTYLQGEPVLPKCSLMYELFCVLHELNGAKLLDGSEKPRRLDAQDRLDVVEDLFKQRNKQRKTVSYKAVEAWFIKKHGPSVAARHISGGQGESGFESKLSSYNDFCEILGVDKLSDSDILMIEEIILWNTIFEDRDILKQRIRSVYGDRLSVEQVKKICKKRYAGWGRLSKKLLEGIESQTDNGPKSIMDILIEGDQNNTVRIGRAMNLMEILHDENLDFRDTIDKHNAEYLKLQSGFVLENLPGSPALRRGINQALRIVDEIVCIAKRPPRNIFIEVAREEDARNKGRRTTRRHKQIGEALSTLRKEDPHINAEFKEINSAQLDERLTLYFMQRGKCMYSGKPLDIRCLSEYQVDHIIPQAYIKDDSFENKVLVIGKENQRKSDSLLLDADLIRRQKSFWRGLKDAKLIGEKKFNNLTRDRVTDDQLKGFIARQLVETSQIIKQVEQILEAKYPESDVLPIKAGFSAQLRHERDLVKCREVNDYHHAHDAFLACRIGQFIQMRHGYVFSEPIRMANVVKQYVKLQAEEFRKTRKMPGSAGFVVSSFLSSGFDKETGEIFKDTWNAEAEVAGIRRCLNYKDCFISRMPEETSGAFWDATIYSPKDAKKSLGLPMKKDLDPQKYGSFSREQFAHFFAYEATNKKNEVVVEFAPVPVSVAAALRGDTGALVRYGEAVASEKGLRFGKILRSKIYKYQQIELEGSRLYITGSKEVRNARQFAFTQTEVSFVCRMQNGEKVSPKEIEDFFDLLVRKFDSLAPRLGKQLGVGEMKEAFLVADMADRENILLALIKIAAAKTNMIDTAVVGGSKSAGCMQLSFSKALSILKNEFFFTPHLQNVGRSVPRNESRPYPII